MSIKSVVKNLIIESRVRPSYRLDYLNQMLNYGQWVRSHREGAVAFDHRYEMFSHLNEMVLRNAPISYLEFGVYKGESIKRWSELNTDPRSTFTGFDSFEGLPENWAVFLRTVDKSEFDMGGVTPRIDDGRVEFRKGWFQQSLPEFLASVNGRLAKNRLVVHLDADLYSSTLYVLTQLHPFLKPGSLLLFDEFDAVTHEFRAFADYVSAYGLKYKLVASSGATLNQVTLTVTE